MTERLVIQFASCGSPMAGFNHDAAEDAARAALASGKSDIEAERVGVDAGCYGWREIPEDIAMTVERI